MVVRLKYGAVVGNHEHFVGVNLSLLAAVGRVRVIPVSSGVVVRWQRHCQVARPALDEQELHRLHAVALVAQEAHQLRLRAVVSLMAE